MNSGLCGLTMCEIPDQCPDVDVAYELRCLEEYFMWHRWLDVNTIEERLIESCVERQQEIDAGEKRADYFKNDPMMDENDSMYQDIRSIVAANYEMDPLVTDELFGDVIHKKYLDDHEFLYDRFNIVRIKKE